MRESHVEWAEEVVRGIKVPSNSQALPTKLTKETILDFLFQLASQQTQANVFSSWVKTNRGEAAGVVRNERIFAGLRQ